MESGFRVQDIVELEAFVRRLKLLGEPSYKENCFFLDIVRTSETPSPPPINLDTQKFSVKENFGLSQPPPLLYEKK